MANLQNLSKVKYIYRVYESRDKVLHCEKYPVVYINSEVVYFKDGRKQPYLSYISVKNIQDNFIDFKKNYLTYSFGSHVCFDRYFWNIETNIEEIYEDLQRQRIITMKKKEKEAKYQALEIAKKKYEDALKEIELLEKLKL